MRFYQIQHNLMCSEDICKVSKEYLNALTCKFYIFLTKVPNCWHTGIRYLSPVNRRKDINSQKQSDFLPILYMYFVRFFCKKMYALCISHMQLADLSSLHWLSVLLAWDHYSRLIVYIGPTDSCLYVLCVWHGMYRVGVRVVRNFADGARTRRRRKREARVAG